MPLQTIDINGSFEELDWEDVGPEQQEPVGWRLDWLQPGELLWDSEDVAGAKPECVHMLSRQLPPDEQLGGENALILEGGVCYKVFSRFLPFGQEFYRIVPDLEPGTRCQLSLRVQVHHQDPIMIGDPWNAEFGCWLDRQGGWNHGLPDREYQEFVYNAVVPPEGAILIHTRCKGKRGKVDFFFDNWIFKGVPTQPEPEPPPDKIDLLDYLVTAPGRTVKLAYSIAGRTGEQLMQGQLARLGLSVVGAEMVHIVKDNQSEMLYATEDDIYRGIDTSPDDDHFYVPRTNGLHGQRWCVRYPKVGQEWPLEGTTTFYRKTDCSITAIDHVPRVIRCDRYLAEWRSPRGPVIPNVVVMACLVGDQVDEFYYFAENLGLVGWVRPARGEDPDWYSYCSEILENQPALVREPLPPCVEGLGLDDLYFVDGEPEPGSINIHVVVEVPDLMRPTTVTAEVRYVDRPLVW